MTNKSTYLPLGTIVSLKGSTATLMIVGRCGILHKEGEDEYCDYTFCMYPDGLSSEYVIHSNHEEVDVVHFVGFSNDDELAYVQQMESTVLKSKIKKANHSAMSFL